MPGRGLPIAGAPRLVATNARSPRVHYGRVKDIFEALEKSASPSFRPLGILADFLEVHGGRENAVEQFLGEDLEMVVVGDWEQAGSGAQLVQEELGGRAAFIVQS